MNKSTQTLLIALSFSSALLAGNVYAGEKILTNKAGMTLYTFDKDSKDTSVCYGPCAAKWPPYIAASDAKAKKAWGLTTRKDGSKQWTFKGQPLYTWVGDTKAGDTTGDGVGGVWHTAVKTEKKSSKYSSYDSNSYDNSSYSPNY
ncbi:MAG: COG4315 family predicted lipoprotein [Cellvibrionaceae bacterium]